MGLFTFYRDGGGMMHVITLLGLASATYLVRAWWAKRRLNGDPKAVTPKLDFAVQLAVTCIGIGLLAGLLGVVTSFRDAAGAHGEERRDAMARGIGMSVNANIWSLTLSLPLFLGASVLRYRVRSMRET